MSVPTFYLFYFLGCAGSSLLLGFSLVGVSKGYSVAAVRGLLSAEVSLVAEHGLWGARASVVAAHSSVVCTSWALQHRLSSCGPQAKLPCGMWDLPGAGIEPMTPTLAGGLFTTEPPGKYYTYILSLYIILKIKENLGLAGINRREMPGALLRLRWQIWLGP